MSALDAALARAAAVSARAAAVSRAEPADPAVHAALDEVSGAAASAAEHAIGERVRRGLLDWDSVWQDPHAHGPGGVRLVQRALVVVAREIRRDAP